MLKVRLYRPFDVEAFVAGAAGDGAGDRRARPHQGARRLRRAALHDVRTAIGEALSGRHARRRALPARRRRPLRPGLQGVHPGDGQGACSTTSRRTTPKNHFTVGINDDVTAPACTATRPSTSSPSGTLRVHVLRPRLRRHGRRQQELDQDHRRRHRQLRPGLLRLRLEEGRRDDGLAPALRPEPIRSHLPVHQADFVACHNFSFLEKYDMLANAEAGRRRSC